MDEPPTVDPRLLDAARSFGRLYTEMRNAHGTATGVTKRAIAWVSRSGRTQQERNALADAYYQGMKSEAENPTAASGSCPHLIGGVAEMSREYGIRTRKDGSMHRTGMTREQADAFMNDPDWGAMRPYRVYEIVFRAQGPWTIDDTAQEPPR